MLPNQPLQSHGSVASLPLASAAERQYRWADDVRFPDRVLAPAALHAVDGNCGLLVAWGVLTYFRKPCSVRGLARACMYTKKHGVFAIALAVALHERGLRVTFHTDADPNPKRIERTCYARASVLGLPVKKAIRLADLLSSVRSNQIAVVLYDSPRGDAHFSPLLGRRLDRLVLPYDDDGGLDLQTFNRRWRAPEVLRQCMIVSGPA
jgi:hypothetical protein